VRFCNQHPAAAQYIVCAKRISFDLAAETDN